MMVLNKVALATRLAHNRIEWLYNGRMQDAMTYKDGTEVYTEEVQ